MSPYKFIIASSLAFASDPSSQLLLELSDQSYSDFLKIDPTGVSEGDAQGDDIPNLNDSSELLLGGAAEGVRLNEDLLPLAKSQLMANLPEGPEVDVRAYDCMIL